MPPTKRARTSSQANSTTDVKETFIKHFFEGATDEEIEALTNMQIKHTLSQLCDLYYATNKDRLRFLNALRAKQITTPGRVDVDDKESSRMEDWELAIRAYHRAYDPTRCPASASEILEMLEQFSEKNCDRITAIVQSSGTGKSAAMKNIGCANWIFYCNLAESGAQAYPNYTPFANQLRGAKSLKQLLCFLVDWVTELTEKDPSTPEKWFNLQLNSQIRSLRTGDPPINSQQDSLFKIETELAIKFLTMLSIWINSHSPQQSVFIICFDECRGAFQSITTEMTTYRLIRRAIRLLHTVAESRLPLVWAIFMDTYARVQNFLPTAKRYPSDRIIQPVFPPPILFVGPIDQKIPEYISLGDSVLVRVSVQFGRPLWAARWEAGDRQVLRFAKEKLLPENPDQIFAMAICGVIAGLNARPGLILPETLVERHLAYLTSVSSDRQTYHVKYLSEPLVAAAVGESFIQHFSSVTKCIAQVITMGLADIGRCGELVATLCLSWGLHSEYGKQPEKILRFGEVVARMGGDQVTGQLTEGIRSRLNRIAINCNHWTDSFSLGGTPNEDKLIKLLRRRAGWICPQNFAAVDLVLPGYVGPHDENMRREHSVPILIQVKNRGLPSNAEALFSTSNASGLLKHFELVQRDDGLNIFWLIDKACCNWSIRLLEPSTRSMTCSWIVIHSPLQVPIPDSGIDAILGAYKRLDSGYGGTDLYPALEKMAQRQWKSIDQFEWD
eukprot:Gregarina_sp_Poly_1__1328@NODE_1329_length_4369_cov_44_588331_g894_i0_p1_GENE_NODE_1329_length_4369_cov_44_588331_g894_i0NODE_1329_length_4369_cov_44_588331_g894_i0_p1_ORF_typecomplete_len728_score48_18DUF3666/PF12408_8/0_58DUF3666/PF12408_8/1_7e03_NODE_1329_length_4369_cov_44_588331_g894_i07872970